MTVRTQKTVRKTVTDNKGKSKSVLVTRASEAEHVPKAVEPEIKQAPSPDLLSAPDTSTGYATADKTTKGKTHYHKTDGRKQSIDRQISALYAAIKKDMIYIRNLLNQNKSEKAIARMRWIVERHDKIAELSRKWETIKAQDAVDKVQGPRPPVRIHSVRKRKTYPTWSNK